MNLAGRAALVTGGGRGIGRGCSIAFAKQGAAVAINYRKGREEAEETAKIIEAMGGRAVLVQGDVAREEDAEAMVKETVRLLGKVDILVANAGIASRGNLARDTSTEEMRRVLDTHVMGAFWTARAAIDSMREAGSGHIVFISSIATLSCSERTAPYVMAKSAIEAFTKVLSKEEGPHGIRVNCIGPGLIETEMGKRLVKARSGQDLADLHSVYPFGRVGQPEDIGNLAAFLCSPEGSYISGQVIWVHGGGFQKHEVV